MNNLPKLALSILLPLLVGGSSGWATAQGVRDWYPTLVKPPFNPPAWVFGPVWTLLYLMMGISLFLIWKEGLASSAVRWAVSAFAVQLVLNFAWSFLFFWAQSPGWAFAEILLLWAAIVWTLVLFFRVSTLAGWLMTPYLAWVTFASVLNASIWLLNR
jgi:tryptophan-rich sensory protein